MTAAREMATPLIETSCAWVCDGRLRLFRVTGIDAVELSDVVRDLTQTQKFPGPNPQSLERADFDTLRSGVFWLCEKTDGVRFALCCVRFRGVDVCCVTDRAGAVFLAPLRHVPTAAFQGTVIDGELAFDKMTRRWTFLAFDAPFACGCCLRHLPFSDRMARLTKTLGTYVCSPDDPMRLMIKSFVPSCLAAVGFEQHAEAARSRFDVDGVIVTPEADGVTYGRHKRMFKLKTSHVVDFELGVDGRSLLVFDPSTRAGVVVGRLAAGSEAGDPPGAILECEPVPGRPDEWRRLAMRTDKATANDFLTYSKTVLNARERIQLTEVLAVLTGAEKPPPPPSTRRC